MTTTTASHPITAGPTPAILWGTQALIATAVDFLTGAALLPFLAHHADDMHLVAQLVIYMLPLLVAWLVAQRLLIRAARLRTPGGLQASGLRPHPASLAFSVVSGVAASVGLVIGFQDTSSMSPVGQTVAAMALGGLAGFFLARVAGRAVKDAVLGAASHTNRIAAGAVRDLAYTGLLGATALTILVTGPLWENEDGGFALVFGAVIAGTIGLCKAIMGSTGTTASGNTMKQELIEVADNAAETVLHHVNPAPTLAQRQRAHTWGRVGGIALLVGAVAGTLLIP